ncbi:hypothetical protein J1N35_001168 [Gossypium stocksii]|uniref:Uncharacterized protein n=1 Tax=Gossypium stocksii TaxID=47602 RepID=A0A9D3WIK1_9ROSI|nr:hypothetical protein J1N35_001168 [Gossypium stocksii]
MLVRRINVRASAQEDGTSFVPLMSLHRVNILDKGIDPLMEAMIRVFQWIIGANPAPANLTPVNRGLLLKHLQGWVVRNSLE